MKSVLPKYFSSEWSFAQFRVSDVRTIVAFGAEKNSLVGMELELELGIELKFELVRSRVRTRT